MDLHGIIDFRNFPETSRLKVRGFSLHGNPIENSRSHRSTEAYIEVPQVIHYFPWYSTAVAGLRLSLMCWALWPSPLFHYC
jgi:hypothetical protein